MADVNDLLVESFPDILDVTFTAQMEDGLDQVEEGSANWQRLLGDFYSPFKIDLEKAAVNMRDLKREEIPTEHKCSKCGSSLGVKPSFAKRFYEKWGPDLFFAVLLRQQGWGCP